MAEITLADPRLSTFTLETLPLLAQLRGQLPGGGPEACLERARHITTYLRDLADPQEPKALRYAKAVRCFLSNKAPRFFDGNLLAGTTTSKRIGVALCPEAPWSDAAAWAEGSSAPRPGPHRITPDEAEELTMKLLPFWRGRGLADATGARNTSALQVDSHIVLAVDDQAGMASHAVPCLRGVLEHGLARLLRQAAEEEANLRRKGQEEASGAVAAQRAVQETLIGLSAYAANLERFAALLAEGEADSARRRQFELTADVCAQVPAGPARTFREAVNALWLLLIGLQAENLHQIVTPGRLDQLLYPWYRRDVDRGALSVREALELIGCLWLKLNDQAPAGVAACLTHVGTTTMHPEVTLGGVDREGGDAVNDLTYLMLRATELLELPRPILNVRCHRERTREPFGRRLAEVMERTGAVSVFPEDHAAIRGLEDRGFGVEQARDFAIIGGGSRRWPGWDRGEGGGPSQDEAGDLAIAVCRKPAQEWRGGLERGWSAFQRQLAWMTR